MRKNIVLIAVCFALTLCACSNSETTEDASLAETELTYQDYYDMGVRYLSEGNYEEAVLAFTAAIEIDPKQAEVYLARADIYVQMAKFELALEDCEAGIMIDESDSVFYIKAVEICLTIGDTERAMGFFQRGLQATGSTELQVYQNVLIERTLQETLDTLSENIVTADWILTSEGTEVYQFPEAAYGWVNGTVLDVDSDEQLELLTMVSSENGLSLYKYEVNTQSGTIAETKLGTLCTLGYCDQIDIMLFYSRQLDCYCIAISDIMVGPYTGMDGFTASLYTVEDSSILQYQSWEWVNLIYGWEQLDAVQEEMQATDWPYMEYMSLRNEESLQSCVWLLRTEVEITSGMMPTEYVRYLRFLNPKELTNFQPT